MEARLTDIVALTRDLNVQVGHPDDEKSLLGCQWGLDGRMSDNGYCFLNLCANHNLFSASFDFQHNHHQCATWRPASATQTRTQIDLTAIIYHLLLC